MLAVLHRKVDDIIPVHSQLLAHRFDQLTKVSQTFKNHVQGR